MVFSTTGIMNQAMDQANLDSICSFCSRLKRGRIYATARAQGMTEKIKDKEKSEYYKALTKEYKRKIGSAIKVLGGDLNGRIQVRLDGEEERLA